jgi:hypothetical protein
VPLALIGFISMIKPTFRKALMHIAVVIGIIAFLGGLDFFEACLLITTLDYQSLCF